MNKIKICSLLILLLGSIILSGACQAVTNGGSSETDVVVNDADGKPVTVPDSSRIVSVGTATTETIYALDAGSKLVGVDNASAEYLPQTAGLPKVGARTTLNAEGILSLKPTLVILNADSGPPQVFEQLRNAGVAVVTISPNYNIEALKQKTNLISKAVGAGDKAAAVNQKIDSEISVVEKLIERTQTRPKVLFVGRGPNMPNATMSGRETTIDEMIKLSGGINPINDFAGFREMTNEAVIAAQPDIILITEKSFERSGGVDGVIKFPGVVLTPAGKNKRILPVSDMYFLGFGPGIAEAVRKLAVQFHPELALQK